MSSDRYDFTTTFIFENFSSFHLRYSGVKGSIKPRPDDVYVDDPILQLVPAVYRLPQSALDVPINCILPVRVTDSRAETARSWGPPKDVCLVYTVWKGSRDTNTSIEFKVTFTHNGINVEKKIASSGETFGGLGEVEVIGQARVKKSGGNQVEFTLYDKAQFPRLDPPLPQLESVYLPEALHPVKVDGISRLFQQHQLPLWNRGDSFKDGHPNPCTIDLGKCDRQILTVTFDWPGTESSVPVRVVGRVQLSEIVGDPYYEFSRSYAATMSTLPGRVTIETVLIPFSTIVPWGIKCKLFWYLIVVPTEQEIHLGPHPVELYGVSARLPPYLSYNGIPREILALFLLAVPRKKNVTSVSEYVKHVVYQAHYSARGSYERGSGSSSFIQFLSSHRDCSFDILRWVGYLRDSITYNVNCYDQGAIVQLGVAFALQTAELESKLRWHYLYPFGFINTLDLVGWGPCDNPFMPQEKARDELIMKGNKLRTEFSNHVFLSWEWKVLDATAGPAYGDLSVEDYLEKSVDRNPELYKTGVRAGYIGQGCPQGGLAEDLLTGQGINDLSTRLLDRSSIPWRADKFLSENGIVPLQGSSDGEANGSGPDSASEFHTFAFNSITEGLRNTVLPDGASVSFKDPIVSSDHESSSWTLKVAEDSVQRTTHLVGTGGEGRHLWLSGNVFVALSGLKTNEDLKGIVDVIWRHQLEASSSGSADPDPEERKLKVNETIEFELQMEDASNYSIWYTTGNVFLVEATRKDVGTFNFRIIGRRSGLDVVNLRLISGKGAIKNHVIRFTVTDHTGTLVPRPDPAKLMDSAKYSKSRLEGHPGDDGNWWATNLKDSITWIRFYWTSAALIGFEVHWRGADTNRSQGGHQTIENEQYETMELSPNEYITMIIGGTDGVLVRWLRFFTNTGKSSAIFGKPLNSDTPFFWAGTKLVGFSGHTGKLGIDALRAIWLDPESIHPPEKAWYALTRSRVVGSQGNLGDPSSDASIVLDGTDRRLTGVFVRDNGGKPGLFARLDSKDHKGEFWQTWALASLTAQYKSSSGETVYGSVIGGIPPDSLGFSAYRDSFTFDGKDEWIIKITCWEKHQFDTEIKAIQFHTNKGRSSPVYGNPREGNESTLTGDRLVYISGRGSPQVGVRTLQAYWENGSPGVEEVDPLLD
ncbi:hypothetical protein FRC05_001988 [Tulasnella sp. 425]|nr:hypothetical protein FRC05_001988 [Tulasnella sp. 425]